MERRISILILWIEQVLLSNLIFLFQGSYFAWKATAMGKNYVNGKTFLEKRYNVIFILFGVQCNLSINLRLWETAHLPLPKPRVTLTSQLWQNFGLGEGWVGSFPGNLN